MWENIFAARSIASARVRGGRDVNILRQVDNAGRPRRGAPVVDMIDVNVRTLPGGGAATRWASKQSIASSSPTVSRAKSPRWYCLRQSPPRNIATGFGGGKLMWVDR